MIPETFVDELRSLDMEDTFNPYLHRCIVHDVEDAPRRRSDVLLKMLEIAADYEVDSIWIGRDLGYRGGRRTGMALTDDVHIDAHGARWGIPVKRPTKGNAIAERTAAVIWDVLSQINSHIFLWNVFPLHPHNSEEPFSNRSHNSQERRIGEDILAELIRLLNPRCLVAIGNDAAKTANRLAESHEVVHVRHPSYGGQTVFLRQVARMSYMQNSSDC